MNDPWKVLDDAEGQHSSAQRSPNSTTSTASEEPAKAHQEHQQAPQQVAGEASKVDARFLAGVVEAHRKVVAKNTIEAAKHAVFIFDDVLPMSFVPPPSWGAVRTRWQYRYKGLPVESLTFENDKTIKRALVPVHGRD